MYGEAVMFKMLSDIGKLYTATHIKGLNIYWNMLD